MIYVLFFPPVEIITHRSIRHEILAFTGRTISLRRITFLIAFFLELKCPPHFLDGLQNKTS